MSRTVTPVSIGPAITSAAASRTADEQRAGSSGAAKSHSPSPPFFVTLHVFFLSLVVVHRQRYRSGREH